MGMQTSLYLPALPRLYKTLVAQNSGEDTYLADRVFSILDLHGSAGYFLFIVEAGNL